MKTILWIAILVHNAFFMAFGASSEHYQLFLWGYYNQLQEKIPIAEKCYTQLLSENTSQEVYSGYLELLYKKNDYKKIVTLMQKVDNQFKNSLPIQIIFIQSLEKTGYPKEAAEKMITLVEQFADNAEVVYSAALAYFKLQQYNQALELIDTYIKKINNNLEAGIFYLLKAQILMKIDRAEEALFAVQKTISLNPALKEGWLLSGAINEIKGNIVEAQKSYQNFLHISLKEQHVESRVLQMVLKCQHSTISHQREKILKEAIDLYSKKNFESALALIEPYMRNNFHDQDVQLLFLELLCACKHYSRALQHVTALIKHNYHPDWLRALHLLYLARINQNEIKKIFATIATGMEKNNLPLLYLADIYLKEKNYPQALNYLQNAFQITIKPEEKSSILYQMALILYEEKKYEKLAQLFDKYGHLASYFAPLANIMAYYYAHKLDDLLKAKELINSFIDTVDNPHFLETKAFILYKEKKYFEAKKIFDSLFKTIPNDFYYLKHAGKMYYAIGNIKKAIFFLEKSVRYAPQLKKNKYANLLNTWKKELNNAKM